MRACVCACVCQTLSICLSICLSSCLSVCLSLSIIISCCMYVCMFITQTHTHTHGRAGDGETRLNTLRGREVHSQTYLLKQLTHTQTRTRILFWSIVFTSSPSLVSSPAAAARPPAHYRQVLTASKVDKCLNIYCKPYNVDDV